jgi:hypothetical protein
VTDGAWHYTMNLWAGIHASGVVRHGAPWLWGPRLERSLAEAMKPPPKERP